MPKTAPVRVRRWQATAILTLFFTAVAGAAAIGWWYARESPPHQGPIVVISADGLPAADLQANGDPADEAGGIAALAADSVVFDRAYTHSTQMLPAHASLLSGRLPFEHGVRDDGGFVLDGAVRTLAELLRNRGFRTGAAVSSFLLRPETGIARGFAFFDAEGFDVAVSRPGSATLDAAERWARSQSDRRYFLLVEVDRADADLAVRRLSSMLEARHWYKGATIVFVGDRGRTDAADALAETALRVPLLIKQPDHEGAGRHVAAPVQHVDLVPTILDLVRAPLPDGLAGRSLRPVLSGQGGRLTPQPIYSEWLAPAFRFGGTPEFALTVNDSRYIRGSSEQLLTIDGAPTQPTPVETGLAGLAQTSAADAEHAMAPLRATLDRLIGSLPVPVPAPPAEATRDRLARAGLLPGLRIDAAPDPAPLDDAQQRTVAAAHEEAARLVGDGKIAAAIRALQAIVRVHPALAAVHYQIGVLSLELGRPSAALAAFRAAAALQPDAVEISRALAHTLVRTGDSDEARAQAARAVSQAATLGPAEIAASQQTAALVALALHDPDAALVAADAAQAADPSAPMRAAVEGRLHVDAGRYAEAVPLLQQAALTADQHDAPLAGVHETLGDALAGLGRAADAADEYRKEIRSFPKSLTAYLGLVRMQAPEDVPAIDAVLSELLQAVPTPEAYAAAERIWMDAGQRSRADAIRSEARVRFRGDPQPALLASDRPR